MVPTGRARERDHSAFLTAVFSIEAFRPVQGDATLEQLAVIAV